MNATPRFFAVVPAAGLSRRMGTPKLALKLGSRSVLEHVVANLVAANVDQVLVLLGKSTEHLAPLVAPPASVLQLAVDTSDMRATVARGIQSLEETVGIGAQDALLLALGDQPTLRSEVVQMLMAEHRRDPSWIRIPVYRGKRGHPLLLPWSFLEELARLPADQGINALVQRFADRVSELPVEDAGVLEDMDDPDDLARHRRRNWE